MAYAHSGCLVYRVRQREYYRTVGWKTLWKPPFLFLYSHYDPNDSGNELEDPMETALLSPVVTVMSEESIIYLDIFLKCSGHFWHFSGLDVLRLLLSNNQPDNGTLKTQKRDTMLFTFASPCGMVPQFLNG